MKKIFTLLLLACPGYLFAQIGLKAGVNFANVRNASSINASSQSGFHIGLLLDAGKSIVGSRTELVYSRQGYDYKNSTNTGSVNLDYLVLPQYMCINITRYVKILLGGQMAFLLNAKVDSSNQMSTGNATADKVMSYYNKFDYGFGGGVEVLPVMGLLIGARINISMSSLYNTDYSGMSSGSGTPPSFIPNVDIKNNLFQIYAGWIFGKKSSKKKK